MRTFDERKQSVQGYLKKAKARKRALTCLKVAANIACVLAIIIGIMHIPYGRQNVAAPPTTGITFPTNVTTWPFGTTVPDVPTIPPEVPPTTYPIGWVDPYPPAPTEPYVPAEVIDVTICMPDEGMARLTMEQIGRFNLTNTLGIAINPTFTWGSAADTADLVAQDPWNAPDLFVFRQDDLMRLVNVGALMPLSDADSQWVVENNLAFTCDTVCYEDQVYAFPMSYRYANLLYYDRSVVSDEDAKSFSAIIAACEAAGKKFCFETTDIDNYFSFFLATGCNSVWYRDAEGNPMDVVDNLNSPEGVIALQGMLELLNSPARTTTVQNGISSTATMQEVYAECGAIMVSGGLYGAAIFEQVIGENTAVAMLPSFRVDGVDYQLQTFADCDMLGMKPQEDAKMAMILSELARFLCGEECQYERFDRIYYMVPSNLAALERAKEKEAYITPLVEQSEFAVPKMLIPGTSWWGFTRDIIHSVANGVDLETALEYYDQRLQDWLDQTPNVWSFKSTVPMYGKWVYFDMIQREDGTWITKLAVYIQEKNLYCFIYNHNDEENYGPNGPNGNSYWESEQTGYFYFVFDPATGDHELIPADP